MSSPAIPMLVDPGASSSRANRWAETDVLRASALWADEANSIEHVAAEIGCSRSALLNLAARRRALFPQRQPSRKMEATLEEITEASVLWAEGLLAAEIAKRVGWPSVNRLRTAAKHHPDLFPSRAAFFLAKVRQPRKAQPKSDAPETIKVTARPSQALGSGAGSTVAKIGDEPEDGESEARPPRSECFRPLRGVAPVLLANCKGCSWPVQETDPLVMSTLFQCSAPLASPAPGKPPYCQAHRDLAVRPNSTLAHFRLRNLQTRSAA